MATDWIVRDRSYLVGAGLALICSSTFLYIVEADRLPGVGSYPLLPLILAAAFVGYPLLMFLQKRRVAPKDVRFPLVWVLLLGALLALPPIAIDIGLRFPQDMNVSLPEAVLFYPAIGFLAEVLFHLLPLALLAALLPDRLPRIWVLGPVVFVEPLFQAALTLDQGWGAILVFGNVALVSAVQLYLFQRFGFGAMLALRMTFYLFWHVLWGTLRLTLLF